MYNLYKHIFFVLFHYNLGIRNDFLTITKIPIAIKKNDYLKVKKNSMPKNMGRKIRKHITKQNKYFQHISQIQDYYNYYIKNFKNWNKKVQKYKNIKKYKKTTHKKNHINSP